MPTVYDKLVRDRIPALIEATDEQPVTHTADSVEYADRLAAKLREEATEFDDDRTLEELADVLEVIDAILAHRDSSRAELERIQQEKRAEKGGFEDRIVLERVDEQ
ncbi:nucleoside triphosphate pyrophosphohydrolase [Natronolimnobius sp. AArcel1]|uniref:nucleoside triphosphate pyrophosphohydrolase n=1 Tax=Natronolimnobius sp. AArcel1 TaxID=1679093 RepID=UPI0013ECA4F7|nr:nucleoside triphosphate pyrophosphohydrolase [Natronolimnobius sp. AArcel1]NGM68714.1 nucleoside triphosphate pyrophosphohydrolase [Natronolimnobius sp. AArcel1]